MIYNKIVYRLLGGITILLLGYQMTFAEDTQLLRFGVPPDGISMKHQLGAEALANVRQSKLGRGASALLLPLDDSLFTLYRKGRTVYLSDFGQNQEKVIWKIDDMPPSGLVPQPILATGQLNSNEVPDLLVGYAIDQGVSNSVEHYQQYLEVVIDGQDKTAPPILLSASDWSHAGEEGSTGNDLVYLDNGEGQPGFKRESLEMLVPATSRTTCMLIVWSRLETFNHPPTHTPASIVFQVETYQLHGTQLVKTDAISMSHARTVDLLRAMVADRRAQGGIPIFLNCSSKTPLKTEEQWFGWWGTPPETVP